MIYTSPSTYAKQKGLWIQASRNLEEKAAPAKDSPLKNITEQIKAVSEQNKMSSIMTKMKTGKRLSNSEKEYLKKNAPDTYQKYQMIEAEREAYRKQLRGAKTKAAADRIHQQKLVALSKELEVAKSSEDSEFILSRAAAINDEYQQYKAKHKKLRPDPSTES